jgi:hypothetical protein
MTNKSKMLKVSSLGASPSGTEKRTAEGSEVAQRNTLTTENTEYTEMDNAHPSRSAQGQDDGGVRFTSHLSQKARKDGASSVVLVEAKKQVLRYAQDDKFFVTGMTAFFRGFIENMTIKKRTAETQRWR